MKIKNLTAVLLLSFLSCDVSAMTTVEVEMSGGASCAKYEQLPSCDADMDSEPGSTSATQEITAIATIATPAPSAPSAFTAADQNMQQALLSDSNVDKKEEAKKPLLIDPTDTKTILKDIDAKIAPVLDRFRLFYQAIRDANIEHVTLYLNKGCTSNYFNTCKHRFKDETISPFGVAFFCALAENDPEQFQTRCQILKIIFNKGQCWILDEFSVKDIHRYCSSLKDKFDKNSWRKYQGPLHIAVRAERAGLVQFLVDEKICDINDQVGTFRGYRALSKAQTADMVRLLVRLGSKPEDEYVYRDASREVKLALNNEEIGLNLFIEPEHEGGTCCAVS